MSKQLCFIMGKVIIQFETSQELADRLNAKAKSLGTSRAAIVKMYCDKGLSS